MEEKSQTNKTTKGKFVVEDPYPSDKCDNNRVKVIGIQLATVNMGFRDLFPGVWYTTQSSNTSLVLIHVPVLHL